MRNPFQLIPLPFWPFLAIAVWLLFGFYNLIALVVVVMFLDILFSTVFKD